MPRTSHIHRLTPSIRSLYTAAPTRRLTTLERHQLVELPPPTGMRLDFHTIVHDGPPEFVENAIGETIADLTRAGGIVIGLTPAPTRARHRQGATRIIWWRPRTMKCDPRLATLTKNLESARLTPRAHP